MTKTPASLRSDPRPLCSTPLAGLLRNHWPISAEYALGEPFIFGLNDPAMFFAELGFTVQKSMPSNSYNNDCSNPIFALYNFHVLSAENTNGALIESSPEEFLAGTALTPPIQTV
jgi:hypothetical protein